MTAPPTNLNPPACIADVMACLDQFQSEIGAKLDDLAAADAAAIQREGTRATLMWTALICVGTAIAITRPDTIKRRYSPPSRH